MKAHRFAFPLVFGALLVLPSLLKAGDTISASPGQSRSEVEDIGEISETPGTSGSQSSKFRVTASGRAEYTSNSVLSGSRSSSDLIFFPSIQAEYATGLGRGFSFDFTANLDSGLYSDRTERSFIGYGAEATVDWRFQSSYPRIYLGVEPYRFDNYDRGGLITEAIGALAGTDWGFSFNSGLSYFFVGYAFENYFSDPNIDTRSSNRAMVGLTHQLKPQLFLQAFYEYQYSNYQQISRDDSRNSVSLSLIWQLNRHLFADLSSSLVKNHSTEEDASYQAVTTSIGLTWQF